MEKIPDLKNECKNKEFLLSIKFFFLNLILFLLKFIFKRVTLSDIIESQFPRLN